MAAKNESEMRRGKTLSPGERTGTKTLVILSTDRVGKGDEDLGKRIVVNFVSTLKEMGDDLWRIVLLNGGVRLAVEGSEVLPHLQALEDAGLGVLVCGGCLETFGLQEKRRVGSASNMLDIVTSMQVAEKVISFS